MSGGLFANFNASCAQNLPSSASSALYHRGRVPVRCPSRPWPGVALVRMPPASGQAALVCLAVRKRLWYCDLEANAHFHCPHHFPELACSGWGVFINLAWFAGLRSFQECPWGRTWSCSVFGDA